MTETHVELPVIKAVLDSSPIPNFPHAIAFHNTNGWTIIVYRSELMQYSDEQRQSLFRFLMNATKMLHERGIRIRWVRE